MTANKRLLLNIITIGGLLAYVIGIYIRVVILGEGWGNILVVGTTALGGPLAGIVLVFVFYTIIIYLTYRINIFQGLNIFLCFFWILSWYQCAINEYLYAGGLPNEPINLFFKWLLPTLWYPAKETVFVLVSLFLTIRGREAFLHRDLKRSDYLLIGLVSGFMLVLILISQLQYINK
jgi:hypothetical protein